MTDQKKFKAIIKGVVEHSTETEYFNDQDGEFEGYCIGASDLAEILGLTEDEVAAVFYDELDDDEYGTYITESDTTVLEIRYWDRFKEAFIDNHLRIILK